MTVTRLAAPLLMPVLMPAMLLLAGASAMAQDSGLARCRAVADSAARLSCYDALPLPSPTPSAAAPAAALPLTPQQAADNFGLERQQMAAVTQTVASIDSSLSGRFEGWGPGTVFRLANGQAWQVSDGSSGVALKESPRVHISRGLMGTFILEIEGVNKAPRVKRIQ